MLIRLQWVDLQGKEWQSERLDGSLHRVKFPTHSSPALSTYCWQGPHQAPSHPLKDLKGFPKERRKKTLMWKVGLGTSTNQVNYDGAPMPGSHKGERGGGHQPPPLARSGLFLKRGSKTDADPSEETTPRGGTWEEHGWVSHLPSRRGSGLRRPLAGLGFTGRLIPDSMC